MASAEKRFTELLDASLILAKSTKRDITKMEPDIILKSPSAINKLSLCLSILLLASAAENSWKLDQLQRPHSQFLPLSPRYCSDSLQRGKHLWILELKPASPGAILRAHCSKSPPQWILLSGAFHISSPRQGCLLQQLRALVPWRQQHGPCSCENLSAPVVAASCRIALNFSHKGRDLEETSQMCWSFSRFIKLLLLESTTAVKSTGTPSFIKPTWFRIWDGPEFKPCHSHLLDMSAWESSLSLSFRICKMGMTVLPLKDSFKDCRR